MDNISCHRCNRGNKSVAGTSIGNGCSFQRRETNRGCWAAGKTYTRKRYKERWTRWHTWLDMHPIDAVSMRHKPLHWTEIPRKRTPMIGQHSRNRWGWSFRKIERPPVRWWGSTQHQGSRWSRRGKGEGKNTRTHGGWLCCNSHGEGSRPESKSCSAEPPRQSSTSAAAGPLRPA